MVSPGQLRLVRELANDSAMEIDPVVEEGLVSYPDAEQVLDADEDAATVLEGLTRRGVLDGTFERTVYLCPSCETEGMRYTTVCPECGSAHIYEVDVIEHRDCGHVWVPDERPTGDDERCPDCGAVLEAEGIEQRQLSVCQECEERTEMPRHALQCRACEVLCVPFDAIERPLYRYRIGERGRAWLDTQLAARGAIADLLNERGFAVEVDATAPDGSGDRVPVHVYAEDDLLDGRVVADVHEMPTIEDVARLRAVVGAIDGRAYLVTTTGRIGERAVEAAEDADITILSADDGELERSYETTPEVGGDRTLIQRLTSVVRPDIDSLTDARSGR